MIRVKRYPYPKKKQGQVSARQERQHNEVLLAELRATLNARGIEVNTVPRPSSSGAEALASISDDPSLAYRSSAVSPVPSTSQEVVTTDDLVSNDEFDIDFEALLRSLSKMQTTAATLPAVLCSEAASPGVSRMTDMQSLAIIKHPGTRNASNGQASRHTQLLQTQWLRANTATAMS
ncbi:hypothetical protein QAD02_008672 [Eretmocerus hayati]|uniref:Uncharacterized protein n=1 Tax=Eretmocerus hayati TaxID=131215 RepID=A0ACC2N745_9HYME|nr:hypothetical protein QAD02_008672 [Eretmocerus hayati]